MIGVLVLLWSAQAASLEASTPEPTQFAQLVIRRQIVVRMVRVAPPPTVKRDWKEKKGPRCVQPQAIAGAAQIGQRSVDLIMKNGTRLRARLASSCPALDYYDGFYMTPGDDGMICADRETIRSRAGGQCEIDAFRTLHEVPDREKD
jgi:hypothetical protein